mmetsp:Transcript_22460/g.40552  ORF Transcript_22460/g.40552 Transcript_22460/m.40552 type:complete len:244 (-) Transcript_22460:103-834(-)|eukprot:CAMPEP_0197664494 /NCGR_PEP_ID=MMETSP1338-20131121/58674_1 /TAXON_ID=43686 ORGANISM="Pelagodinium beii, Strain RCC1491" /NCGR_SAMPLE_ID=MMETSP1338 /ASSEMBLY_ACC=CAM_ASM_000754 /LENGTH=243 /DNA_ID=CAMNT_0043243151 /DNA_START=42 /DNA_END=773 /DNA_ORIENTATION=-
MTRNGNVAVVGVGLLLAAMTPLAFVPGQFTGARLSPRSDSHGFSEPSPTASGGLVCAMVATAAVAAAAARGRTTRRCEGSEWRTAEQISAMTESVGGGTVDNIEIAKILPHRYPFLLVDKVIHLEKMKRAVGVKNITANEPQFTGHFPDRPIMPGVLMVEALAQLAGVVCMNPGDQVLFAGIDGVKFKKMVVPGDTLVMEVEVLKFREKIGIAKMSGKGYVDGKVAIIVKEFTCALVKEENAV